MAAPGSLGWITPDDRTELQTAAHAAALAKMPKFGLAPQTLAKGERVILSSCWKHPDVVADIGFVFDRFHQLTGSCIGCSLGNGIVTLSGVQRLIADDPQKAFLPFWPFDYGRARWNEGDRGQGEGAVNSSACDVMRREGVLDATTEGLPTFRHEDGLVLTSHEEMLWSDGGSALVKKWGDAAKLHPLGTAALIRTPPDVTSGVVNGYPGYFGCDYYVGSGAIHTPASGEKNAYVRGRFNGRGGHSTTCEGVWNHPDDGMLYLYGNQWPAETYPFDPAGGRPCSVWIPESELTRVWSQFNGEFFLLSHLTTFPMQPKVLTDWMAL